MPLWVSHARVASATTVALLHVRWNALLQPGVTEFLCEVRTFDEGTIFITDAVVTVMYGLRQKKE